MDTELIVAVAQIATGMATLIVALFLAGQLLLQRKQLDIAHQDSIRELGFTARTRQEEVILARLTDESLLSTYLKADGGLSILNPVELHKFAAYMRLLYMQTINDWLLGAYENNRTFFRGRLRIILTSAGARELYVSEMRTTMSWLEESGQLKSLGDTVYEELEGSPVPA
jgi:hypothetical protein